MWKTYKLSDIGTVVGGATPSTTVEKFYGGDIPWLTPKDLSGFKDRYIERGERNITQEGLNSCSAHLLPENSVLFSSRAPIGYVAIAKNPIATNQGFKSIIPNANVDSLFLYYALKYNKEKIEAMGSGTTFKEVSGAIMKNFEISLPPLEEQRRIAGILGAIDDKIECNRRINANLELQAQALFDKWCESCSKNITIKELADNILDYTPNANSEVVLLNSSDVTQGVFAKLPLVSNVNLKGQFKKRFQKGDILYSEIRPRNKHYAYCYFDSDRYIASTRLIVLRGKKEKIVSNTLLYQYLISQNVFEEFTLKTETRSGTFPQGNYQDLSSIVVPYSDKQREIAGVLDSIYKRIWHNNTEMETLTTLRDTLLPKLMNGEIKVAE